MKKFALLTALSVLSLSTVAMAETPAAAVKTEKMTTQQNAKTAVQKDAKIAQNNAAQTKKDAAQKIGNYKGTGSRSLAQFKRIDKDSNGTISQAEFTAANVEKFNKKDKNKDGNVSPAEFSPTLAKREAAKKS